MSTITTSASCFSAIRCAVVEPTNPAPKTVTLRFIDVLKFELGSRSLLMKSSVDVEQKDAGTDGRRVIFPFQLAGEAAVWTWTWRHSNYDRCRPPVPTLR